MEKITLTGVQETMLQTVFAICPSAGIHETGRQNRRQKSRGDNPRRIEGMEVIAPIYKVIGKIPAIRNLSNKIIVLAGR